VTEIKFHLSGNIQATIDAFLEISGLATTSVLDGDGAHVTDGTAASDGSEVGPTLTTTAKDFIIARFFSTPPLPTAATSAAWQYNKSYVYQPEAAPGKYQPTLTGAKAGSNFCVSMAAFKIAPPPAVPPAEPQK
jgi:hypothetical protein